MMGVVTRLLFSVMLVSRHFFLSYRYGKRNLSETLLLFNSAEEATGFSTNSVSQSLACSKADIELF